MIELNIISCRVVWLTFASFSVERLFDHWDYCILPENLGDILIFKCEVKALYIFVKSPETLYCARDDLYIRVSMYSSISPRILHRVKTVFRKK